MAEGIMRNIDLEGFINDEENQKLLVGFTDGLYARYWQKITGSMGGMLNQTVSAGGDNTQGLGNLIPAKYKKLLNNPMLKMFLGGMGGNQGENRRSKSFTLPIAPIVGILSMPTVKAVISDIVGGRPLQVMDDIGGIVGMGSDGVFHWDWLMANMIPLGLGIAIHKLIGGKLGVNRVLASAGVPILRI
ncbi:hypothetical protein WUBG_09149 [Wuchereria bancrofti]|uniref:Uncharacterized protein n=1 Tax=Wuchereria bancrofti TaxID=6293 RepID=J9EXP0_WUCBA|nr:hypothetical protein WUBG_09149 [Wuchereria bancrofti]